VANVVADCTTLRRLGSFGTILSFVGSLPRQSGPGDFRSSKLLDVPGSGVYDLWMPGPGPAEMALFRMRNPKYVDVNSLTASDYWPIPNWLCSALFSPLRLPAS
jgi:hypothetical protein